MVYSPFECLIIVTYCVFKYFEFILKPQKVHSPPAAQPEIASKEVWEKILFLDKNIPYLEDRRGGGGVTKSLN